MIYENERIRLCDGLVTIKNKLDRNKEFSARLASYSNESESGISDKKGMNFLISLYNEVIMDINTLPPFEVKTTLLNLIDKAINQTISNKMNFKNSYESISEEVFYENIIKINEMLFPYINLQLRITKCEWLKFEEKTFLRQFSGIENNSTRYYYGNNIDFPHGLWDVFADMDYVERNINVAFDEIQRVDGFDKNLNHHVWIMDDDGIGKQRFFRIFTHQVDICLYVTSEGKKTLAISKMWYDDNSKEIMS